MTDDPTAYGRRWAGVYDEWFPMPTDTEAAADFLLPLCGAGPVLELGIGSGRVALALLDRGLEVHGIESSPDMLALLRSKPRGNELRVVVGDMSTTRTGDLYSLVYIVFNTLYQLHTQGDQLACCRNASAHLLPGGHLVIEAFIPDVTRETSTVRALEADADAVFLSATLHDPVLQLLRWTTIRITPGGVELFPDINRYVWPSELDLMSKLAGLQPVSRHGGWNAEPFTARSSRHVSVYVRPARCPSDEAIEKPDPGVGR